MDVKSKSDLSRLLPSLDEVLQELAEVTRAEGHAAVADAARNVLAKLRAEISSGHLDAKGVEMAVEGIAQAVERGVRQGVETLIHSVIPATGGIPHTNLWRAPPGGGTPPGKQEKAGGDFNLDVDHCSCQR